MLAMSRKAPFHKDGWVYKEKYDEFRLIAYKRGNDVRLISRNLKDLTERFPRIAKRTQDLPVKTIILDGEVAVFDEEYISNLAYLRPPIPKKFLTPPIFVAFRLPVPSAHRNHTPMSLSGSTVSPQVGNPEPVNQDPSSRSA